MKIDYMDEVVPEYGAALDECTTFGDCMSVLDRYRELFPDALAVTERLPDELPAHHPLMDARQSARQLLFALGVREGGNG